MATHSQLTRAVFSLIQRHPARWLNPPNLVSTPFTHILKGQLNPDTVKLNTLPRVKLLNVTAPSSYTPNVTSCMHAQSLSGVQLFETPWTVACQVPLPMGFFRQEYWSGLQFPPPGDLPDPGIKPASPESPELAGRFFTAEPPGKPNVTSPPSN